MDVGSHAEAIISSEDHAAGRATGRKGGRARVPKPKPAKRSLKLSINEDTYERLSIHAMRMTNGNISELVSRLADLHCRDYHISRTPGRGEGEAG